MAQTALIAKTKHFPTAPFQNVFSAIFQKCSTCVAGCVGGCVSLCVTSEKAATNTGQRGKREGERERMWERENVRERRLADCQLVLILNYQKLFAIFESFALSAVSGRAGTRREHRGGGVAVATSCLTSCTHSFGTNSLAPYTHTASHTGADSQVYYVWLWPESMQHFNMCVSWRTFACVRERKGEHTGGVSRPAPHCLWHCI